MVPLVLFLVQIWLFCKGTSNVSVRIQTHKEAPVNKANSRMCAKGFMENWMKEWFISL